MRRRKTLVLLLSLPLVALLALSNTSADTDNWQRIVEDSQQAVGRTEKYEIALRAAWEKFKAGESDESLRGLTVVSELAKQDNPGVWRRAVLFQLGIMRLKDERGLAARFQSIVPDWLSRAENCAAQARAQEDRRLFQLGASAAEARTRDLSSYCTSLNSLLAHPGFCAKDVSLPSACRNSKTRAIEEKLGPELRQAQGADPKTNPDQFASVWANGIREVIIGLFPPFRPDGDLVPGEPSYSSHVTTIQIRNYSLESYPPFGAEVDYRSLPQSYYPDNQPSNRTTFDAVRGWTGTIVIREATVPTGPNHRPIGVDDTSAQVLHIRRFDCLNGSCAAYGYRIEKAHKSDLNAEPGLGWSRLINFSSPPASNWNWARITVDPGAPVEFVDFGHLLENTLIEAGFWYSGNSPYAVEQRDALRSNQAPDCSQIIAGARYENRVRTLTPGIIDALSATAPCADRQIAAMALDNDLVQLSTYEDELRWSASPDSSSSSSSSGSPSSSSSSGTLSSSSSSSSSSTGASSTSSGSNEPFPGTSSSSSSSTSGLPPSSSSAETPSSSSSTSSSSAGDCQISVQVRHPLEYVSEALAQQRRDPRDWGISVIDRVEAVISSTCDLTDAAAFWAYYPKAGALPVAFAPAALEFRPDGLYGASLFGWPRLWTLDSTAIEGILKGGRAAFVITGQNIPSGGLVQAFAVNPCALFYNDPSSAPFRFVFKSGSAVGGGRALQLQELLDAAVQAHNEAFLQIDPFKKHQARFAQMIDFRKYPSFAELYPGVEPWDAANRALRNRAVPESVCRLPSRTILFDEELLSQRSGAAGVTERGHPILYILPHPPRVHRPYLILHEMGHTLFDLGDEARASWADLSYAALYYGPAQVMGNCATRGGKPFLPHGRPGIIGCSVPESLPLYRPSYRSLMNYAPNFVPKYNRVSCMTGERVLQGWTDPSSILDCVDANEACLTDQHCNLYGECGRCNRSTGSCGPVPDSAQRTCRAGNKFGLCQSGKCVSQRWECLTPADCPEGRCSSCQDHRCVPNAANNGQLCQSEGICAEGRCMRGIAGAPCSRGPQNIDEGCGILNNMLQCLPVPDDSADCLVPGTKALYPAYGSCRQGKCVRVDEWQCRAPKDCVRQFDVACTACADHACMPANNGSACTIFDTGLPGTCSDGMCR